MKKDNKNFFDRLLEPPSGLFDRIILTIKREQELEKTKRLLFGFLLLFFISLIATHFLIECLLVKRKILGPSTLYPLQFLILKFFLLSGKILA
jgi:hypothetical protein